MGILIILVILALIVGAVALLGDDESVDNPSSVESNAQNDPIIRETEASSVEIDLGKGLFITRIDDYTGIYMEDGSDQAVTGLMMVMLENRSEKALQLAKFSLEFPHGTATFSATSLPAGERAVVLEESRMEYAKAEPEKVTVDSIVMAESMELHADKFEITGLDGALNVRNISDEDISGDIYVYYKNYAHETFYGGITYRAKVEGGLEAGEVRQVMTQHYDAEGSKILMVTYAE